MSAPPREIRRLAFQVLFQLDARGERDAAAVRDAAIGEPDPGLSERDKERACELAASAFAMRIEADRTMLALAPQWPAHRQAAVDRAILRLAYFEMTSGRTPPKVAVNEAVELAKEFSTDKSPGFVNGLLDKVLKKVLANAKADRPAADSTAKPDSTPEAQAATELERPSSPPPHLSSTGEGN